MTAQATLDWHHEIHHAIIAALPNHDYELIAFNQAKSTESIYANVLHGQRLFYLRFSWHENKRSRRFADASYDLRRFGSHRELIASLRKNFLQPQLGNIKLGYWHFVWLALLEKLGQTGNEPLRFAKGGVLINQQLLDNPAALHRLSALINFGLAIAVHEDSYLAISKDGLNLLNHYWDVADFTDSRQWDDNPRIMTIDELIWQLNNIKPPARRAQRH
ncbi:hypothetical protein ACLUXQ_00625 [Limosilactobacillus mucosae]|nr:hypothetical protein [Limosilactobacillus mucosae]